MVEIAVMRPLSIGSARQAPHRSHCSEPSNHRCHGNDRWCALHSFAALCALIEEGSQLAESPRAWRASGTTVHAMTNRSYPRIVGDCSAVPRPAALRGMPSGATLLALALGAGILAGLSLTGTWSWSAWWSALSAWAPIGVLVTLAVVLGWQLQLTHTALGALELVRKRQSAPVSKTKGVVVLIVTWAVCLLWFVATILVPGV